jgi:hypothetical protein
MTKRMIMPDMEKVMLAALVFVSAEEERFSAFLDSTGLTLSDLREATQKPGFTGALLDFLCSQEDLARSFAHNQGLSGEQLNAIRWGVENERGNSEDVLYIPTAE